MKTPALDGQTEASSPKEDDMARDINETKNQPQKISVAPPFTNARLYREKQKRGVRL